MRHDDLSLTQGTLFPGEVQQLSLHLNAADLSTNRYLADIVFNHNATNGETVIPITVDVFGERRVLRLDLISGWNMISMNIEPENLDIREIVRPLVEAGVLIIVKDGAGRFYRPDQDFINLDDWAVTVGYQLYLAEPSQLVATGMSVPPETPIDLTEGWNLKAYFPPQPIDAVEALAGITDQLIIAKDGLGNFYMPAFDYSNMDELREGQGYQLKVSEPVQLIYRQGEAVAAIGSAEPPLSHFTVPSPSGINMSLLAVVDQLEYFNSHSHCELGVFTQSGILSGAGRFDRAGRCGVAVWGDNPDTHVIEGAVEDEK